MKAILAAAAAVVLAGCSQQQGTAPTYEQGASQRADNPAGTTYPQGKIPERSVRIPQQGRAGEERVKLSFLNRIREADPQFQTIERAVMNDQNELGIILSKNVSMDDIPALMRTLMKQMASQFPGENLTVIAYAPTEPPMPIGTGRLDARTQEMTYTPAQQNQRR